MIEDRIREFVAHDYSKVVRVVDLVLNDLARSEDAVCDALERAWTRLERGDSIDNLAAWCTTVSLNRAKSHLRRAGRERRAYQRHGLPGHVAAAENSDALAVREALAALPRRQRELTVLRYFAGMSIEEAAATLGMGAGAARSLLWNARKPLARSLAEPIEAEVDAELAPDRLELHHDA